MPPFPLLLLGSHSTTPPFRRRRRRPPPFLMTSQELPAIQDSSDGGNIDRPTALARSPGSLPYSHHHLKRLGIPTLCPIHPLRREDVRMCCAK